MRQMEPSWKYNDEYFSTTRNAASDRTVGFTFLFHTGQKPSFLKSTFYIK